MKLKVCGLTTSEQIEQVQKLGIDYAGLIFYEKSVRYALPHLEKEKEKIRIIDIKKVGVFVNADMGFLKSLVSHFNLAAVQLHGDETPAYCAELQNEIDVIKVFRISAKTENIDALVVPFMDVCTYFLFDTDTEGYGGSGNRFDWTILCNATIGKPFFLSGGIREEDAAALKSFTHPYFYAADINSRFETAPGIKDMEKVKRFKNSFNTSTWTK
ncbi:MAG TPA: phosphoribosylanthranilate isomerase [Chitinophagaceae bacterium]|nr:phosphoribosylanthranilate isomerase [Chitinophagaceae bacterium]